MTRAARLVYLDRTMPPIENIADAVPSGAELSEEERKAVVEIAFLAVAADRVINEDEERALRRIGTKVLGHDAERHVATLLASPPGNRDDLTARLQAAAARLGAPKPSTSALSAREAAYKAAYAAAMSDLASSDEEFEFDLDLVDALALSQEDADRLAGEVVTALQPGGGEGGGEGQLD